MDHVIQGIDKLAVTQEASGPDQEHQCARESPGSGSRQHSSVQTSLLQPKPSHHYLAQACNEPQILAHPRPLLVILDLNGTLLHRTQRGRLNGFIPRPMTNDFLQYLLRAHRTMIWASSISRNVQAMCESLLRPEQRQELIAVWGREKLRLPRDLFAAKVQVYKQLSWVWEDEGIQKIASASGVHWDQSNTVLVDDSLEKGAGQPYNTICITRFEGTAANGKSEELAQLAQYLESLRWQKDVSAYMRVTPYKYDPDAEAPSWREIGLAETAAKLE